MRGNPLVQAFDRLVSKQPTRALVLSPGRRATAEQVDALARAAARPLEVLPPGAIIGLLAPNGPAFLASLLALARAGATAVLFDHRTPSVERCRVARDIGAYAFLSCAKGWPDGPEDWRLEAFPEALPATRSIAPGGVIKLTSGTTGSARGIAASAEALLADDAALIRTMGIAAEDRLLANIPFSHSYGLSSLVIPCLVRGLPLIVPESGGPFGPISAAQRLEATVFPTVPAFLSALTRLADPPPTPPTLRLVLSAGALLRADTAGRFRERFGQPVHVFYGSSESGGITYDREGGGAERGTVGTPVEGARVELEELTEDSSCGAGRVIVRSPAVADTYLPMADPRLADGCFRTQDLGRWNRHGELLLVSRLDDIINVRGKKVNPREVQRVLTDHPAIEEVEVLAIRCPERQEPVIRAVIACPPGSLSRREVLDWCRGRLADHKRPRSVVLLDRLPRTPRGKVDRAALGRLISA
ncbi:MAG: fatty acid--CoA ligase family protein [Acidobacteriota bacterium]